ncbi:MAG: LysM peptidoglycan-binding domain-containing protein, partial [Aliifodinibius sp.]|nr:LysM peptidoglycan-binding domain-containing protein [Fodinibius sp.]
ALKPQEKSRREPIEKPTPKKPRRTAPPKPPQRTSKIASQEPVKKEEIIAEHTVEAGETLSHISLKYYNSAVKDKWMIIYQANKEVIGDNPNLIKPGMVLKIPKLDK